MKFHLRRKQMYFACVRNIFHRIKEGYSIAKISSFSGNELACLLFTGLKIVFGYIFLDLDFFPILASYKELWYSIFFFFKSWRESNDTHSVNHVIYTIYIQVQFTYRSHHNDPNCNMPWECHRWYHHGHMVVCYILTLDK